MLTVCNQSSHIDRTDFLNGVVREKKRFEDILDDCVAGGLNAGTDALMNQVPIIRHRIPYNLMILRRWNISFRSSQSRESTIPQMMQR